MGGDAITLIRGKGLLNAVVIDPENPNIKGDAMDFCYELKNLGLLAKPTHGDIIRLAPPLCINESEIMEAVSIFEQALTNFQKVFSNFFLIVLGQTYHYISHEILFFMIFT